MHQTVREACLWLPEAEEVMSHGSPNFRVRSKTFATFVVNHHGDGNVALWLPAPPGAQDQLVRSDPKNYFVPPYVGPRGWLGVQLDRGLAWKRIVAHVREAYEWAAPRALVRQIERAPAIKAPGKKLTRSEIDPMQSVRAKAVLRILRKLCLRFPETSEAAQFGNPSFKAGRKTFAIARHDGQRLTVCFWTGIDRQGLLAQDPRFSIPPYMGHNGWIALDVSAHCDRAELDELALQSYRHFASLRMQRAMKRAR